MRDLPLTDQAGAVVPREPEGPAYGLEGSAVDSRHEHILQWARTVYQESRRLRVECARQRARSRALVEGIICSYHKTYLYVQLRVEEALREAKTLHARLRAWGDLTPSADPPDMEQVREFGKRLNALTRHVRSCFEMYCHLRTAKQLAPSSTFSDEEFLKSTGLLLGDLQEMTVLFERAREKYDPTYEVLSLVQELLAEIRRRL